MISRIGQYKCGDRVEVIYRECITIYIGHFLDGLLFCGKRLTNYDILYLKEGHKGR